MKVWHSSGRYDRVYLALIDTGADENFIRRSVVEELELDISPIAPTTFKVLHGTFEVSERVQPKWQFRKGSKQHVDFPFFVVTEIPNDTHMVLGNIIRKEMRIDFQVPKSALVAHEAFEGAFYLYWSRLLSLIINECAYIDLPTRNQQQQRRERQDRDTTASQTKARQDMEASHEQKLQERAAANAVKYMRPGNPTSQKGSVRSGGHQRC